MEDWQNGRHENYVSEGKQVKGGEYLTKKKDLREKKEMREITLRKKVRKGEISLGHRDRV